MSVRGRVGRHTQAAGRQCQNWSDDQQTVIALLNGIPVGDGGAGGAIAGRVVSGLSSDALYRGISQFEDRHFPRQRHGFVDPGGPMLRRMEELAARAARPLAPVPLPAAPETPLDILRRNVLDETRWKSVTGGERAAFAPLVTLAVKHIDFLKSEGFEKLSWPVEMFGRAYVTRNNPMPTIGTYGAALLSPFHAPKLRFSDVNDTGTLDTPDDPPPLPEMRYGHPVSPHGYITTAKMGALLLYSDNTSYRVRPYHTGGEIRYFVYDSAILQPKPIRGADLFGIH